MTTASRLFHLSIGEETRDKYAQTLLRFRRDGFPLPCTAEDVCAAVALQWHLGRAPGTMDHMCAAVARFHRESGLPNPCNDYFVRQIRTAFRSSHYNDPVQIAARLAAPHQRSSHYVAAFDSRVVSWMLRELPHRLSRLSGAFCRQVASILLGYFFMLRPSTILRIRCRDIRFLPSGFELTLAWEKTRHAINPRVVRVAGAGGGLLSQPWLLLVRAGVTAASRSGDVLLFPTNPGDLVALWPSVSASRSSSLLSRRRGSQHSARSAVEQRLRQELNNAIRDIVNTARRARTQAHADDFADLLPTKHFSGRSLRSGGATAANQIGYSDRALERHADWQCSATVKRYVRQALCHPDAFVSAAFFSIIPRG